MGIIYRATCPECEYEEEFRLGGGLMSIDLLWNLRFLSREEQEIIQKMDAEGRIEEFFVENKLTACIHCDDSRSLKKKTMIQIRDKEQKMHSFGSRCEKCGKELKSYEEIEKVLCPVCNKAYLSFERAGVWD